jgi:hypothetical protein
MRPKKKAKKNASKQYKGKKLQKQSDFDLYLDRLDKRKRAEKLPNRRVVEKSDNDSSDSEAAEDSDNDATYELPIDAYGDITDSDNDDVMSQAEEFDDLLVDDGAVEDDDEAPPVLQPAVDLPTTATDLPPTPGQPTNTGQQEPPSHTITFTTIDRATNEVKHWTTLSPPSARAPAANVVSFAPGPTALTNYASTLRECFELIFVPEIMDKIVKHTNQEASRVRAKLVEKRANASRENAAQSDDSDNTDVESDDINISRNQPVSYLSKFILNNLKLYGRHSETKKIEEN